MDDIQAKLSTFITREILKQPKRTLTLDEALLSSGLIDSFSLMDLSIFIENTFGVRIDETELNPDVFDTLSQLSSLIKSRQ